MGKSVFSLVLDDEVVAAADRLAYRKGVSRSALINRILAEALSCATPETRSRSVFDEIAKWMDAEEFRFQTTPSESVLSIHSALHYKYNPRIRYSVELTCDGGRMGGEFKAWFRTQNQALIQALDGFLEGWMRLEQAYIGDRFPDGIVPCEVQDGRYRRRFLPADDPDEEEKFGRSVAAYIRMFDAVLKTYFAALESPMILQKTENAYLNALKQMKYLI